MNMEILIIGKLAIRADWRNKRRPCFVSPWWAATVTLFSSAGFFFLSNNEICSKYLRKFDRKGYFSYLKKNAVLISRLMFVAGQWVWVEHGR
jgi:hypothetical protein